MKLIRMHGLAMLLGLCALPGAAGAAMDDLVRETQRLSFENGQISMVWWIPLQFWDESIKTNPSIPDAARTEILGIMEDYTVVALLRARAGAEALEDLQPKEELLKNTRVEINGKLLEPLPAENVSPAAGLLLSQLKPLMVEAAGQVGEGLEFVIYPGKIDGKPLIDAAQPGNFTISFYGRKQLWRLPLGSLLPTKADKATGEVFPGNYEYNPFTGRKLEPGDDVTPASKPQETPAAKPAAKSAAKPEAKPAKKPEAK